MVPSVMMWRMMSVTGCAFRQGAWSLQGYKNKLNSSISVVGVRLGAVGTNDNDRQQ